MSDTKLRAGAALIDITPPLGCSICGHFEDRRAARIHDPLHVRCLVLDDGATRVAIAVCDLIAVPEKTVQAARHEIHRHTGIPEHHILICATHTHYAVASVSVFQSEQDAAYLDWLVGRIVDGVRGAATNLAPARIGFATADEPRLVFNRRFIMKPGTIPPGPLGTNDHVKMNPGILNPDIVRPSGPTDPQLALLGIQTEAEQPLALLASYALHYIGNNPDDDISADYFAMFAQEVTHALGQSVPTDERPPFLAMLANACSGQVNNIDVSRRFEQPYPYAHMRQVARTLAGRAVEGWKQLEFSTRAPLAVRETSVDIDVRKPTAAELQRARAILEKSGKSINSAEEVYARETVLIADYPDRIRVPLQAIRIGDTAIAAWPGEIFVELGLELKRRSPFRKTMCIELANAYAGYFPTLKAFEEGGYETWRARSSFAAPGSGEKLLETLLTLLSDLHRA